MARRKNSSAEVLEIFRPWYRTDADWIIAVSRRGDHNPLADYLLSGKAIPLSMRVHIVKQWMRPEQGRPRESDQAKYKRHAQKQLNVAAAFANDIERRFEERNIGPTRQWPNLHLRAATEAIKALQARYPGKYRLKPDAVVGKMHRMKGVEFRRICEFLAPT